MRRLLALLVLSTLPLTASSTASVGVHHNYRSVNFDTPHNEEGYTTGIDLGYEYQCWNLITSLNFESYWNIVDLAGPPCLRSNVTEYLLDWRVGYQFCYCNIALKPFVGFGWNNFQYEQDASGAGIHYRYNTLYVPVGFEASYGLSSCIAIGLRAEWRPDVYARLKFIGQDWNISKENGFRIALPVTFCFDWKWCGCPSLAIVPFYDWKKFGHIQQVSAQQVAIPVPDLSRWDLGLAVILKLTF